MRYRIDSDHRPAYLQLYEQLKHDILNGGYAYGGHGVGDAAHYCGQNQPGQNEAEKEDADKQPESSAWACQSVFVYVVCHIS